MFDTVLIANRGEIARRIIRTCKDMGLRTVAVYSEADAHALFVQEADLAVLIGEAAANASYLSTDKVIGAAKETGAGAIHPGYGFLSENESFARACGEAGIVFIGPTPDAIAAMGSKIAAKKLMASHGVPVVPGFDGGDQGDAGFIAAAADVGFPLLVKASAGGGGKGMRLVTAPEQLPEALATARREASAAFGDPSLLIERYVERPRHIEVQILGDAHGHVVHVFERECSIQRRHQKIVEESPSPAVDAELRASLGDAAVKAGLALGYQSAGTVEFVMGADRQFYFLEVNTRLQVEHPVTEMVTGLDLVRLQVLVAMGQPLPFTQADLRQTGSAIEVRLYAEDPDASFLPQTGRLLAFHLDEGPGMRVDSGVAAGDEVGIHYDPMLAKIIAWGADRAEANRRLARALERSWAVGVKTNLGLLRRIIGHPAWLSADITTHFIAEHEGDLLGVSATAAATDTALRIATALRVRAITRTRQILPALQLGWRNNPGADPSMVWDIDGQSLTCAYRVAADASVTATIGDLAVRVELVGEGEVVHVGLGGRRFSVRCCELAPGFAAMALGISGTTFELQLPDPFASADAAADAGSCKAPMPGRVVAVRVAAGDRVAAGQPLVVLEAMKMEHTVEAPRDGIVATVQCSVDEVVKAQQELVIMEG